MARLDISLPQDLKNWFICAYADGKRSQVIAKFIESLRDDVLGVEKEERELLDEIDELKRKKDDISNEIAVKQSHLGELLDKGKQAKEEGRRRAAELLRARENPLTRR